jgi:hypothetical protein
MSLDFFLGFGALTSRDEGNDEKGVAKQKTNQNDDSSETSGSIQFESLPSYSEIMYEGKKEAGEYSNKKGLPLAVGEEQRS